MKSIVVAPLASIFKAIDKLRSICVKFEIEGKLASVGQCLTIEYPVRNVSGHQYISVGNNVMLHNGLWMAVYKTDVFADPKIKIGSNVCINYNCQITAINEILIGDNVIMGSNVLITDHSHGDLTKKDFALPPINRQLYSKGPVKINQNVWIGAGAVILPNVTIGENSIVAANSLLYSSFPPNSLIAGNPARLLKRID